MCRDVRTHFHHSAPYVFHIRNSYFAKHHTQHNKEQKVEMLCMQQRQSLVKCMIVVMVFGVWHNALFKTESVKEYEILISSPC